MKTFFRILISGGLVFLGCGLFGQYGRYQEVGDAVYYADYLHGQPTSLGEIYDKNELTCAHKTHPLGTLLKVTRLDNNRTVTVRVNDRGPYSKGCVIDLSRAAAEKISLIRSGKTRVKIEVAGFSDVNPRMPDQPEVYVQRRDVAIPQSYSGELSRKGLSSRSSANNSNSNLVRKMPRGQGGYVVQLVSYKDAANARRQIIDLQKRGVANLYLWESSSPDGSKVYRLVVGPFSKSPSAHSQLEQLKNRFGLQGVVVFLH